MKYESHTKNAGLAIVIKYVFTGAANIPFSFLSPTVENINHVFWSGAGGRGLPSTWQPLRRAIPPPPFFPHTRSS